MVTSFSPLRATGGLPGCYLQGPVGLVEVLATIVIKKKKKILKSTNRFFF